MKSSHAAVLAIVAALVPSMIYAADDNKPTPLTDKEVAAGWIMLFDGQTPFGWTIKGGSKGTIDKGILRLGGAEATTAQTNSEFCCFELSFEYAGKDKGQTLKLDRQDIELSPTAGADAWTTAIIRTEVKDGKRTVLAVYAPAGKKPGTPKEVAKSDAPGRTPIAFNVPAGTALNLRNIKLTPLNAKPIFNGKNLDGWYIVNNHQSKFSVTDKGELNIKDGNGEIKTEGEWADFVLQLDVFSNGKNLNSGIFFRALPGKEDNTFWQGYEAQIRNEWQGYSLDKARNEKKEDRTKPHDIGTGGIYNRQPTRKVVSNDKEWFTYTVLANGNHIATWVNGYQTTDYFDNNEPNKTVRNGGQRLEKGCISLQGHDPTTDLSFRNIRIQELPAEKK